MTSTPTVVLVHGAFADAAGWVDIIKTLHNQGIAAIAPANPLRSLSGDTAYLRSILDTIEGPLVLVGHSYGGAVITNAATGNDRVIALVYVAAFALEQGETVGAATTLGGAQPTLTDHISVRPFPDASEGNADAYIDRAYFHELFGADLDEDDAAAFAATQRPAALATLGEPSGVPAWRTIPAWYQVSTGDKVIPPEAERFMAERAGAQTIELDASHVSHVTHPDEVANLILEAVRSVEASVAS